MRLLAKQVPPKTAPAVVAHLRALGDPANVVGMARYGIRPGKAFGVSAGAIRSLAKEIGCDHPLATALWSTAIHDARAVAALIADPARITEQQADAWAAEFDSWAICDTTCLGLFWKTPFAWRKVREWSRHDAEYVRRSAFSLLAALAVHDKAAPDERFVASLALIRKAAGDDRNMVKKAVNWALRQIGKRNLVLRQAALATARELAALPAPARWIGSDAFRELSNPAVEKRLRARARRAPNPPHRKTP